MILARAVPEMVEKFTKNRDYKAQVARAVPEMVEKLTKKPALQGTSCTCGAISGGKVHWKSAFIMTARADRIVLGPKPTKNEKCLYSF